MFPILIWGLITWVYTFVKTSLTVYYGFMNFYCSIYIFYSSKKKRKEKKRLTKKPFPSYTTLQPLISQDIDACYSLFDALRATLHIVGSRSFFILEINFHPLESSSIIQTKVEL